MDSTFKTQKVIAIIFSIFYVGLGTVSIFTSYGSDKYYFDGSATMTLFTFPVSIIGQTIRFVTDDYMIPVIIVQMIMLWATYKLVFLLLKYRYKKSRVKTL